MKGLTGDHSPESRQLKWESRGSPWAAQGHPQTTPRTTLLVPSHVCAKWLHSVRLFVTLWKIACQAPPSMGFSRQEYWSGLPCLPPEDLPGPGIELTSLTSSALADGIFIPSATWEAPTCTYTPRNDSWGSSPPTTPAGPLTQGPDSEQLSLLWLLGELLWLQSAAQHPGFAETPADSKGVPSKDVWNR